MHQNNIPIAQQQRAHLQSRPRTREIKEDLSAKPTTGTLSVKPKSKTMIRYCLAKKGVKIRFPDLQIQNQGFQKVPLSSSVYLSISI